MNIPLMSSTLAAVQLERSRDSREEQFKNISEVEDRESFRSRESPSIDASSLHSANILLVVSGRVEGLVNITLLRAEQFSKRLVSPWAKVSLFNETVSSCGILTNRVVLS